MQNQPIHSASAIYIDPTLLTNQANGNNTWQFQFQRQVTTTSTSRIAVTNISIPYSWYNITTANENTQFQYVWFDGASTSSQFPTSGGGGGGSVWTVNIPPGYYDLPTLNAYLQYTMINNNHYLVDNNGNFVYYLEIVYNTSYYSFQLNSYQLPSQLPAGWSNPGTAIVFSGANSAPFNVPKILLNTGPSGVGLFSYFGFNQSPLSTLTGNTYPTRSIPTQNTPSGAYTVVSTLSDVAPNQTPVTSVCLTCEFVDNPMRGNAANSSGSRVLTTQNVDAPFGSTISHSNLYTIWIPLVSNQSISKMQFQMYDQNGNQLTLNDPNSTIELLLTDLRYS